MNSTRLQALIELDSGEFHVFQCIRARSLPIRHREMADAQQWLIAFGMIELVGDEFHLTQSGKDVLEGAAELLYKTAVGL